MSVDDIQANNFLTRLYNNDIAISGSYAKASGTIVSFQYDPNNPLGNGIFAITKTFSDYDEEKKRFVDVVSQIPLLSEKFSVTMANEGFIYDDYKVKIVSDPEDARHQIASNFIPCIQLK